jgi:hypothetical protein
MTPMPHQDTENATALRSAMNPLQFSKKRQPVDTKTHQYKVETVKKIMFSKCIVV